MKITASTPFVLRPYTVSTLVSDAAVTDDILGKPSLSLGRALAASADAGRSVVVALPADAGVAADKPGDYKRLAKAFAAVAGETVTGSAVAKSAWSLSALPATTTPQELTKLLVANNVSPIKAPEFATDILKVLNDPISRGVLIAISAGAATYIVVQRTEFSTAKKWTIIVGVGALAGGLYALARYWGVMV